MDLEGYLNKCSVLYFKSSFFQRTVFLFYIVHIDFHFSDNVVNCDSEFWFDLLVKTESGKSRDCKIQCLVKDHMKWLYVINRQELLVKCNKEISHLFGAQIVRNPSTCIKFEKEVPQIHNVVESVFFQVVNEFGRDVIVVEINKTEKENLVQRMKEMKGYIIKQNSDQYFLTFLQVYEHEFRNILGMKAVKEMHNILFKLCSHLDEFAKKYYVGYELKGDSKTERCFCEVWGLRSNVCCFIGQLNVLQSREPETNITNKHSLSEIDIETDLDNMLKERNIACAVQCHRGKVTVHGFSLEELHKACQVIEIELVERVKEGVTDSVKKQIETWMGKQKKKVTLSYNSQSKTIFIVGLKTFVEDIYKKVQELNSKSAYSGSVAKASIDCQAKTTETLEMKEDLYKEEAEFLRSSMGDKILFKLNNDFKVHFELHGLPETVKGDRNGHDYYWKSSSNKTLILDETRIEDSKASITIVFLEDDKSGKWNLSLIIIVRKKVLFKQELMHSIEHYKPCRLEVKKTYALCQCKKNMLKQIYAFF